MEAEESVEVERARIVGARGARDGDGGAQRVVRALAVRNDDVERVGGAALEEADEDLAPACARQLGGEGGAAQERRRQPHGHEGEGAGLHEDASLHGGTPKRDGRREIEGCVRQALPSGDASVAVVPIVAGTRGCLTRGR